MGPDKLLQQPPWSDSNRWFYCIRVRGPGGPSGDCLQACVAADIEVRPLWYPNHLQQPYMEMQSYRIENALYFYDRLVNLPCSVSLTPGQVEQVVTAIRQAEPGR